MKSLRQRTFTLSRTSTGWVLLNSRSVTCSVKVRSTRPPAAAEVDLREDRTAEVRLTGDGDTIAPGQACVFYESGGTRLLGGGWITRPQPATGT